MPLRRCCCLPNVRRLERPGASWKNGSASRLTVTFWYQVAALVGRADRAGLRRVARRRRCEGGDGSPLHQRDVHIRAGARELVRLVRSRRGHEARAGERDLVGQVLVGAADQLDLVQALAVAVAVDARRDAVDLDQLALEEAGVEPAAVVPADQRAGDLVDRDVVDETQVRRRRAQGQRLLADRVQRVDRGVVAELDPRADHQAGVAEAAGDAGHDGRAVEGQVAGEELVADPVLVEVDVALEHAAAAELADDHVVVGPVRAAA